MNRRDVHAFIIQLTSVLVLTFGLHVFILTSLHLSPFNHLFLESYVFNYVIAILCFFALDLSKKKFSETLGFVFLSLSALKFLFFFVLFYPSFQADGIMDRVEFFNFFIPYSVCLFVEVYNVLKGLKRI